MIEFDYEKVYERIFEIYKLLHQNPELDFNLEKTVAIVKNELDELGVNYTEKYGKSSVVAEIGQGERCIALRADMDALPIEEDTGLEYSSQNKGVMHACGHDSHTAILLGVASCLKEIEKDLNFRVRLIFQPSEEGAKSGAKMLIDNGVMDGVEEIIATHCDPRTNDGEIGVRKGASWAACMPMKLSFLGKSAHATLPEYGVDAISMACEAFFELKNAVKEESHGQKYIWSAGKFHGGTAFNIICDKCELGATFRFYDMDFAERVKIRCKDICENIAKKYGGQVIIDSNICIGPVINDSSVVDGIKAVAENNGIKVNDIEISLGSEDFGWYTTKTKGCMFKYGVRNEEYGSCNALHNCKFKIYPPAMKRAVKLFVEYILSKN